jgi:8-oxo-dGTP pyrophosphatase MutT (NUDIX family)
MKFAGRTATAIIPFPPDKILLIKRSKPPFVGYWALHGGRVDPGETVEQTIVREVKEEKGLDIKSAREGYQLRILCRNSRFPSMLGEKPFLEVPVLPRKARGNQRQETPVKKLCFSSLRKLLWFLPVQLRKAC